ncbi:DUF421 domain-containing protein [Epilithonimonas arachidiradicis]|uniref:DUF421 domain-containing protein n=1 Tax=Epilithonimonas arachidiradicis TaxID=1617282 RepID=A0A420D9E8_9FLAO|nr:YetF domain-containing protein [Epilithonimonas arachidiradicis]RKE87276.1 uncharacterized protein DUF421 [Epilithonimonas arachidiradicis]GGG59672.1 DUF421 domain-containing protein [Epilithonimonas arachidiradicis]
MKALLFDNWEKIGQVALMTVTSFVILFLFIRISGKRTLAKFNAFDFVVTVALGSTLSYMMLAMVPLLEGVLVLLLIIALQYFFAKLASTSDRMEHLINSSPRLLFYKGHYIKENMSKEAITVDEIYAVVRQSGIEKLDDVLAVVIELNGEISVIKKSNISGGTSSLKDLSVPDQK